jgi:hypothetical protein
MALLAETGFSAQLNTFHANVSTEHKSDEGMATCHGGDFRHSTITNGKTGTTNAKSNIWDTKMGTTNRETKMDSKNRVKRREGGREGGKKERKKQTLIDLHCSNELMSTAGQKQRWKKSQFWAPATHFRCHVSAAYCIQHLKYHQAQAGSKPYVSEASVLIRRTRYL